MKIKFEKHAESVLNKLFLYLTYMSGDADAWEYEEVEIEGVNYLNYQENLDKIKVEVDKYKLIGRITDCNDSLYIEDRRKSIPNKYEFLKKEYGQEIADLYQETPGDSTNDHQVPAHLSDIKLHAYNEKGELLISYV